MLHWPKPPELPEPGPAASREIELKLDLDSTGASQLADLPIFSEAPKIERQLSIYYDTPKAKLWRNGWILRIRQTDGRFVQTIKRLRDAAGLFDRDEWQSDVSGTYPEWQYLAESPLAVALNERQVPNLAPLFRSDVTRSVWAIVEKGSAVEASLDVGLIQAGDATAQICELELELVEGDPRILLSIAKKIGARIPVRLGVLSKSQRGYALAKGRSVRPVKATHVALGKGATVAEGFTAIVNACLKHFRLNEPLLIDQRDSEALHQLRVAIRRIRSALWLFRPAVEDTGFRKASDRLRRFTRELGTARNIDVILASMRPDNPARDQLERDRRLLYGRIIRKLDSRAFRAFVLDLLAWTHTGEWRSGPKASKRLMPFAKKRLDRLWWKIEERAANLSSLTDDERHRLRIDTKKIRYALQFLDGPLKGVGPDQKAFAEAAEGVQDSLGLLNDLATRQQLVPESGDPWLFDREAARYLRAARRHLHKLADIGPYWRKVRNRTVAAARPA